MLSSSPPHFKVTMTTTLKRVKVQCAKNWLTDLPFCRFFFFVSPPSHPSSSHTPFSGKQLKEIELLSLQRYGLSWGNEARAHTHTNLHTLVVLKGEVLLCRNVQLTTDWTKISKNQTFSFSLKTWLQFIDISYNRITRHTHSVYCC